MCNHFEVNYQGEKFSKQKKFQMNSFSGLFFDGEIVREQIIVFIHEIIILLIYSQAILWAKNEVSLIFKIKDDSITLT